jgi:hypothetical protein
MCQAELLEDLHFPEIDCKLFHLSGIVCIFYLLSTIYFKFSLILPMASKSGWDTLKWERSAEITPELGKAKPHC